MNFQKMLFKLEGFWIKKGCFLWHPYSGEVGAGTLNPMTFFGVLGPRPWRVVYLEPSQRPADGRYGENPVRLYQHYQLQVIMKPPPPGYSAYLPGESETTRYSNGETRLEIR